MNVKAGYVPEKILQKWHKVSNMVSRINRKLVCLKILLLLKINLFDLFILEICTFIFSLLTVYLVLQCGLLIHFLPLTVTTLKSLFRNAIFQVYYPKCHDTLETFSAFESHTQ